MFGLIWFIGFLFTVGFIDFDDDNRKTLAALGWKGTVTLLLLNLFLTIICLIAWPYVLGNDIKKTMMGEK